MMTIAGTIRSMKTIYTSTFTFAMGDASEEFHTLDQAIATTAKSIPGYLGEEAWENPSTGLVSNVYYWESMEALRTSRPRRGYIGHHTKRPRALAYQGVSGAFLRTRVLRHRA